MGIFRLTPGIRNIMVVTSAVFLLDCLLTGLFTKAPGATYLEPNFLTPWLGLIANPIGDPVGTFAQVWRPFTYMLVHASIGHLFFNMIGLWFLGVAVEEHLGPRRLYRLYLACGLAGAAFSILGGLMQVTSPFQAATYTVGASGAVLGVVMAFVALFPHATILLWFLIPVKAMYLGIFYAVTQVWTALSGADPFVATSAHLGGMVAGFMMARNQYWFDQVKLPDFKRRWRRRHLRAVPARRGSAGAPALPSVPMHTVPDPPTPRVALRDTNLEAQVDAILDKVRTQGMDSLSTEEKRTLDLHSTRLRQRDHAR